MKAYSLGFIAMIYSFGITHWQLILIYMMQHVAVIGAHTAFADVFIIGFSADEGHLGKTLSC